MNEPVLGTRNLKKTYHDGTSTVEVLKGIDLTIAKGDRVAIIGRSGSGKSTLLHLLGGLDKPTEGDIMIGDTNWQALNEKQRCRLRNQRLGFVYQFHHLLPEFTALENVAMPLLLAGINAEAAANQAESMLEQVELKPRLSHKPSQLSGGERQRVAIARALVHQPYCVLADEPTGNLDQTTAQKVFDLMLALNQQLNTAIVIVTHDQQLAERMDRVLVLQEGRLI